MKLFQALLCAGVRFIGSLNTTTAREILRYDWPLFIYNHRITETADLYLPLSKSTYDPWVQDLNALPARPFDAPKSGVLAFPQHTGDQVLFMPVKD